MIAVEKPEDSVANFLQVHDSCRRLSEEDLSSLKRLSSTCSVDDGHNSPLPLQAESWPQRPLLLRPTPGTGMKILGVRYSSSKTYLPSFEDGQILPINNGLEREGECLVIDFESDWFIGTICLRLKNSRGIDSNTVDSPNYYFRNRKRTFQSIIRGRFKKRIPMSECVTGQMLSRMPGVVPPRLIVKAAILVVSRLAPQLQSSFESGCPRFLSPLCSTAQHIYTTKNKKTTDEDLEGDLQEPHPSAQSSLIQSLRDSSASRQGSSLSLGLHSGNTARIKNRKKIFNELYESGKMEPSFCTESEYCFEFFQHLIHFDKFTLDFPKPVGEHSLKKILNGQPLQILALHQKRRANTKDTDINEQFTRLWSFDIWHESIYQDAVKYEEKIANQLKTQ